MTRALPYTQASVRRRIEAARKAGLNVTGIAPDGTVLTVEKNQIGPSILPGSLQDDPYVAAVERGSNAKAPRKRYARS
jgi:hypothetical protein